MKRLSQVLAWVLVFGIVGLSIVPPDYRVITGLPRLFEHFSIFLLAGVAFGLGYPGQIVKIASGFPIGIGGAGCSCGAVIGGCNSDWDGLWQG